MSSVSQSETDIRYRYACDIARAAASRAYSFYQQRERLITEQHKDRQDVASEAGHNVEQLIKTLIAERFPQDALCSEADAQENADTRFLWVIEPLDGTRCFINGLHNWCVSLALVTEGEAVAGVVYDPNHREMFHACRGQGAWVNETRLRVHPAQHLNEGVLGVGISEQATTDTFIPFLSALLQQGGTFIRTGSGALMSAWAAAGRLIGYYAPHMRPRNSLAGIVLMQEAGGISNDYLQSEGLKNGNPLLLANEVIYHQLNALLAQPVS